MTATTARSRIGKPRWTQPAEPVACSRHFKNHSQRTLFSRNRFIPCLVGGVISSSHVCLASVGRENAQAFVISGRPGSACVVGFQADGELTAVCVLDANAEVQQLRTRIQITSPGPLESPAMGRGLAKP